MALCMVFSNSSNAIDLLTVGVVAGGAHALYTSMYGQPYVKSLYSMMDQPAPQRIAVINNNVNNVTALEPKPIVPVVQSRRYDVRYIRPRMRGRVCRQGVCLGR